MSTHDLHRCAFRAHKTGHTSPKYASLKVNEVCHCEDELPVVGLGGEEATSRNADGSLSLAVRRRELNVSLRKASAPVSDTAVWRWIHRSTSMALHLSYDSLMIFSLVDHRFPEVIRITSNAAMPM